MSVQHRDREEMSFILTKGLIVKGVCFAVLGQIMENICICCICCVLHIDPCFICTAHLL